MKYLLQLIAVAMLLQTAGCNSDDNNDVPANDTPVVAKQDRTTEPETAYREPDENEVHDYFSIKDIEDDAYPVFWVTLESLKGENTERMKVNAKEVGIDTVSLHKLQGKQVRIYYAYWDDLVCMEYNGKYLAGKNTVKKDHNWKNTTGTLRGADVVTSGDLPATISVVNKDGTVKEFRCFVNEEMVKANGKEVAAWYMPNDIGNITYIIE